MYKGSLINLTAGIWRTQVRKMSTGNKRVGILGVPFAKGQKKDGVDRAPKQLRLHGLIDSLNEIENIDVVDYGDVIVECKSSDDNLVENMHQLAQVSAWNKEVSTKVKSILKDKRVCVTIGGDHSIGIGTIDGHYNYDENVVVLWVDAHADINTNKTSGSGSVHGMPLALLVKELSDYWPYLPTMDWQVPKFSIRNLAYIGLRSVDKYERVIIDKYGIPAFGMEEVQKLGIPAIVDMALEYLDPKGTKSIHVSFDIDSLDKLEAPSTGTSVRGGLTLREAIYLMEKVYDTGRLDAIDLVEINPSIGSSEDVEKTLEAGIEILKAGLGFSRKGCVAKDINDLPIQTFHKKQQNT